MWSKAHLIFCVTFLCGLTKVHGGVLVFDILRNTSAGTSEDICASLACAVEDTHDDAYDIQQIISLIISEKEGDENTGNPLAGLSFFDAGIHVYHSRVNGKGHLLSKGGELKIDIKGSSLSCISGVVTCELRFINSKNKGQVVNVAKKLQTAREVAKSSENNSIDSNALDQLKNIIIQEVNKISKQFENFTNNVASVVKLENQQLLRLKDEDLLMRLDTLDQRLNKLEMTLNEHVKPKLTSLTETVDNSTDSITIFVSDRFNSVENQISILEVSLRDRMDNAQNWTTEFFKTSRAPCEDLQANMSVIFHNIQNHLSTFTSEAIEKISAVENRVETSGGHLSVRRIMEAIVRMSHNISEAEGKLKQLRTDLDTEVKTVHVNISSLRADLITRHDRLSREVKKKIDNFDVKLTNKFKEFDDQTQSLAIIDEDLEGRLFNFEVTLKDIKDVLKNIKYIFGL
uniref:Uncharacterized protein n=1 Tax=Arion vulgaris TaxID=1028688 RepID=A0A0B7AF53_9EUPU